MIGSVIFSFYALLLLTSLLLLLPLLQLRADVAPKTAGAGWTDPGFGDHGHDVVAQASCYPCFTCYYLQLIGMTERLALLSGCRELQGSVHW